MADVRDLVLVTLVVVAISEDCCSKTISNRLIVLGLMLGMGFSVWGCGISCVAQFLLSITFPVISLYLLFRAGILGAGDIKLFSVIGSFIGFRGLLSCMGWACLAGGVIAFLILLWSKRVRKGLRRGFAYVGKLAAGEKLTYEEFEREVGSFERMHASIPIGIGLLITLCRSTLGIGRI